MPTVNISTNNSFSYIVWTPGLNETMVKKKNNIKKRQRKIGVNTVKSLIALLENATQWVLKVEERLCNQENLLDMSSFSESSKIVQRLLLELDEIQSLLKSKQDEINRIRNVSDKIVANKSNIKNDIVNLKEILDAAEDIKKRYRDIFVQISDRQALLQDINQSFQLYEKSYQNETKWIRLLEIQISDYDKAQMCNRQQRAEIRKKYGEQQSYILNMDDEINELKKFFRSSCSNIH